MSQDADAGIAAGAGQGERAPVRSGRHQRACIAVVGEFNSGKTALANALVGAPVLAPSAVTHTACATVVAFAARPSLCAETADRRRVPLPWDVLHDGNGALPENTRQLHVGMPLPRLKHLRVIDTPGLGFADEEGDRRSLDACRNADTVIWCTPAMQAWKASEERAWLTLPARVRARGILAVTFADQVTSPADIDRLLARLRAEAGPWFQSVVLAVVLASECALATPACRGKQRAHGKSRNARGPRIAAGLVGVLPLP